MADLADLANRSLECRVNFVPVFLPIYAVHVLKTDFRTLLQCSHRSHAGYCLSERARRIMATDAGFVLTSNTGYFWHDTDAGGRKLIK
jgi:hypothetical protein